MKRFLFGLATAVLALGTTAKTLSTEHSPAVSTVDFVGLFDPFWASLPSFTSGTFGQISVSGPEPPRNSWRLYGLSQAATAAV